MIFSLFHISNNNNNITFILPCGLGKIILILMATTAAAAATIGAVQNVKLILAI
jgi:hypothetical protein